MGIGVRSYYTSCFLRLCRLHIFQISSGIDCSRGDGEKAQKCLFLRSVECLPHCCLGRWEWASGSDVNVPCDDLQLPRIKLATSENKNKEAHVGYFSPFVKNTKVEEVADVEQ